MLHITLTLRWEGGGGGGGREGRLNGFSMITFARGMISERNFG